MKVERTKRHTTGSVRYDKRRVAGIISGTTGRSADQSDSERSKTYPPRRGMESRGRYGDQASEATASWGHSGKRDRELRSRTYAGALFDRVYRSFLNNHIRPKWSATLIQDVQPRPSSYGSRSAVVPEVQDARALPDAWACRARHLFGGPEYRANSDIAGQEQARNEAHADAP